VGWVCEERHETKGSRPRDNEVKRDSCSLELPVKPRKLGTKNKVCERRGRRSHGLLATSKGGHGLLSVTNKKRSSKIGKRYLGSKRCGVGV